MAYLPIFSWGLSHLCPKIFSTTPEKLLWTTHKVTLSDSLHPIIISKKNPDFWALYLARRNEFRLKNTQIYIFSFLAAAQKIMALSESGPLAPWPDHEGCGEGVSPSPLWVVSGEGCVFILQEKCVKV